MRESTWVRTSSTCITDTGVGSKVTGQVPRMRSNVQGHNNYADLLVFITPPSSNVAAGTRVVTNAACMQAHVKCLRTPHTVSTILTHFARTGTMTSTTNSTLLPVTPCTVAVPSCLSSSCMLNPFPNKPRAPGRAQDRPGRMPPCTSQWQSMED